MTNLFRTRGPTTQLFKTREGAIKRMRFENAHSMRWSYQVLSCDERGDVTNGGDYFKLARYRKTAD